jgi:hypothetical protein
VADNLFDYNYKTPIVPTGSTVSNTAVSGTAGYQGVTATANQDASILYNMPEADRKILAQRLKNAGYRVAVTGKYSDKLLSAYSTASMKAALQSQMVGQAFTVGQYLDQEAAAIIAAGGAGGGGGPSVRKETRISDDITAKALIDAIFQDTLGRKASGKEILKYTSAIQKAQKTSPTVTTYATSGGVTSATTTGGFNEQQYLIDQIAGTDEAKSNQVLGYYKAFMNALGGK